MRTGFSIQGVLSRCSGGGLSVSRCLRLVFPVPAGPNTSMLTMLTKTCPCFIASSNNRFDSKRASCARCAAIDVCVCGVRNVNYYDKMDYHKNWIISAYSIIRVRLFKRMLNCRFFVRIEALFLSNSPSC